MSRGGGGTANVTGSEALLLASLLTLTLATPIGFVMPAYRWGEQAFYGAGLKLYDALAGGASLGGTRFLDREATLRTAPGVQSQGLRGGVQYWDGQFDDARLALALARTAAKHGALLINHLAVTGLTESAGRVTGLQARDGESGRELEVQARCVVNAAGVWVDGLREMDARMHGRSASPLVRPSQGIHLVVDRDFWPGEQALLVPSTRDGRILFAVPWLGKVLLGTTDTPTPQAIRQLLDHLRTGGASTARIARPATWPISAAGSAATTAT